MLTLYGFLPSGNVYKVRLLLAQLRIPHRRVEVSQITADTARPEFRAINPIGKVPTVVFDDGRMLSESGAILHYLANLTRFWPPHPWDQAQVLRWMFFEQNNHEPNIAGLRFWNMHAVPVTPLMELWAPARRASGEAALAVMDGHLAVRSFFVGERYSIADVALYAYTHVAPEGGFDLAPYPHLVAWLARVAGQPGHIRSTRG